MILLLSGTTELARAVLVENILKDFPVFRHIAIEDLAGLPFLENMSPEEQEALAVSIACQCAKELQEEALHSVISHDNAETHLPMLREELGENLLAVHIGAPLEVDLGYHHTIDTANRSASDVYAMLKKILTGMVPGK